MRAARNDPPQMARMPHGKAEPQLLQCITQPKRMERIGGIMSGCNAGPLDEVVSIVLAGGKGSRLHDLTQAEAKPALPVGPDARLVDFTLANIANSGLRKALVLTQYEPASLQNHVERCWGADPEGCSFQVLDGEDFGPFEGTAHAVASVIAEIDRLAPRLVVILGGDHIYLLEFRPFLVLHIACVALATVGVIHVPLAQALGFGVLDAGADFRIQAFVEKPAHAPQAHDRPGHALASMGIYVFDWQALRAILIDMSASVEELDFGQHVIPRLVAAGTAYAYALPGRGESEPLWHDLGTLDAYHAIQCRIRDGALPLDAGWPIVHARRAMAGDSGSIGLGSVLRNVVALPGARLGRFARISDAIVTGDAVLPDHFDLDAELAAHGEWCTVSEGGIRVVSAAALRRLEALRRPAPVDRIAPLRRDPRVPYAPALGRTPAVASAV